MSLAKITLAKKEIKKEGSKEFFIFLHLSILMEKSYCGEVGGKINEIRDNNKLAEKSIVPKNRISYDC